MRALIVYASKNGTTETCVERLREGLQGKDVTLCCIEKESVDLADFDVVVFGSPIYFGRLRPSAREFLKANEQTLMEKSVALFLCCAQTDDFEYYSRKCFSAALREHAFANVFFGGSLKTEGLSFWDRMIVRSMRSELFEKGMDDGEYIANLPVILPENIDKLAGVIRGELNRLAMDKMNNSSK